MADTNTYDLFQKVEKWTTKAKFNALGNLTEIATGTEYNLAGAIDETDLASDLQTKINGKLTTPTTPTADSAVTMLADGTVGTKPLSEIGGGKLYRHDVTISNLTSGYLHCTIINNTNTEFAASDLNDTFFKKVIIASVDAISMHKTYTVKFFTVKSTEISATYYASYPFSDTGSLSFSQNDLFSDTVTEI